MPILLQAQPIVVRERRDGRAGEQVPFVGQVDEVDAPALAEFRLDADESKELLTAYGTQISRYKNLGFVKLKEQFISDYTNWIQKESAGYRVMEKDVRSWFERKIPLKARE